ncbi:MAG: AbrB/MazE/SpoVT family DNA-binding domain-containing protein [Candidatus Bathyarchaeia archaeon]
MTRKYQITIPKEVREELGIEVGDDVVFVKGSGGRYHLMTVDEFTREFVDGCKDIDQTVDEVRKGLARRVEG